MDRRFDKLFCNDLHSDLKFLIENENIEFPAHKMIVGYTSDVLNKMVYGNGGTLPASVIVVPNCSSDVFLVLLKYMYTGNLEWNLDIYDSVLEVSKYFGLTESEKSFKVYVAHTINYDNALEMYIRFFHVNDYVCHTAMKIIQLVLKDILNDYDKMVQFFELPIEAFTKILQMGELGIDSDLFLFNKMITWAKTKDQQNLSSVLDDKIKLIRFVDLYRVSDVEENIKLREYLQAKLNTRWNIQVINSLSEFVSDNGGGLQEESEDGRQHYREIIDITSRDKVLRLHGIAILSSDEIYVQHNDHFVAIPCFRSKVHKFDAYDLMFEKPIEISRNGTVRIKVPRSSVRYLFEDHRLFSIRAEQRQEHSIAAIFISTTLNATIEIFR